MVNGIIYTGVNILINLIMGIYSYKTKKLTLNACIVAFFIGVISIEADYRLFVILIAFFLSSSFFTKVGNFHKEKILSKHKEEKVRSVKQVLCNGLPPGIVAMIILIYRKFYCGSDSACVSSNTISNASTPCILDNQTDLVYTILYIFYISYIACCNGDTWASEIGIFSKNNPVLITNLKVVPKGTNGGVSLLRTVMSCLGGSFIGILWGITQYSTCSRNDFNKFLIIFSLIGLFSGFFGSAIDSVLGALFQISIYDKVQKKIVTKKKFNYLKEDEFIVIGRDILSNDTVNFLTANVTALLCVGLYKIL